MTTLPMTVRADGLPERVTIYEVGPRDGLQNEQAIVPVAVKAEFVRRLVAAGLPIVEATSFVHPRWVPQLADAAELMTELGDEGRDLPVLVPNERGLDRAQLEGPGLVGPVRQGADAVRQRIEDAVCGSRLRRSVAVDRYESEE